MLDENVNDKKIEELNKKLDDLYEKFRKQSSKNLVKIFSLIIGLFGSAVIINSFIVTPSFAILSFFYRNCFVFYCRISIYKKNI